MNPQDQDQHTSTPEGTLGGAGTLPVAESPSEPQNTAIPAFDEATLQAIDSIEAEPTATVAQAEPAPESSTLGVTNTPPIATVSAPQSPVPPVVTEETTSAESTAAGVAAAMGAQSVQTPTQATSPFNSENKPKSRKGLVIVLIIVLALAAGAAGYFVYQSLNSGAGTTTETTPFEEKTGGSEPDGDDVPVEGTVNP